MIPDHCFELSLTRSLAWAVFSVSMVVVPSVLAWQLVPVTWAWLPYWLVHALAVGTACNGVWVLAHECGHGAFARQRHLQDAVGFILHSALLVPYFSWQRSHAIHHAKTNHLTEGETHVPRRADHADGHRALHAGRLPVWALTLRTLVLRLVFGWPAYLVAGVTGGPERGVTNHFWPLAPFSTALFPRRLVAKVLVSAAGVVAVIGLLVAWAVAVGSVAPVLALYVGPYLVGNAWLVTYTWLHHTSPDTPHYDDPEWTYVRGAFCSIDRPYNRVIDRLHHHIGTTHAVHHLFHRIPHYHAVEATKAVRTAFPELYRFDPTPPHRALWRIARDCVAVAPSADGDGWRYLKR